MMAATSDDEEKRCGIPAASAEAPPGLHECVVPVAGGGGVAVGSNYNRANREYVEVDVLGRDRLMLEDFEAAKEDLGSDAWKEWRKDLRLMDYHVDREDGWLFLGIPKYEGKEPDKGIIMRRTGMLSDMVEKNG
jgi:hypothetical protein